MSVMEPAHREEHFPARVVISLIHIAEALREDLAAAARDHGLQPLQARLLIRAFLGPHEESTVTNLAEVTNHSAPTVSDSLRSLVRRGLLERKRSEQDNRVTFFLCTEEGSAVAGALTRWPDSVEKVINGFDEGRQRGFLGLLTHLLRYEVESNTFRPGSKMCASCRYFEVTSWEEDRYYCQALEKELRPSTLRTDCILHETL